MVVVEGSWDAVEAVVGLEWAIPPIQAATEPHSVPMEGQADSWSHLLEPMLMEEAMGHQHQGLVVDMVPARAITLQSLRWALMQGDPLLGRS